MRVYINNRNYLTWTRELVRQLVLQDHEPIIIDNDSRYEPLLDWYNKQTMCQVCRLAANVGHAALWHPLVQDHYNYDKEFVLTDSDIDIRSVPHDWPEYLSYGVSHSGATKCGLSLDVRHIPSRAIKWPQLQEGAPDFWGPAKRVEINWLRRYYDTPTDTTFAVYRPNAPYRVDGWRADYPYTALHLPWHLICGSVDQSEHSIQIPFDEEHAFYFANANSSSGAAQRPEIAEWMRIQEVLLQIRTVYSTTPSQAKEALQRDYQSLRPPLVDRPYWRL